MAPLLLALRHQRRVPDDVGEHDRGEAALGGHALLLREPDAAEQVLEAGVGAEGVQVRVGLHVVQ